MVIYRFKLLALWVCDRRSIALWACDLPRAATATMLFADEDKEAKKQRAAQASAAAASARAIDADSASEESDAAKKNDDDRDSCKTCTDGGRFLVVIFTCVAKLTCKLCNCKATDPSPLNNATPTDKYGGKRVWAGYSKVKDASGNLIGRKPSGRCCGICYNTFYALGLDAEHGTIKIYFANVSLPAN